jgi:hypothetical protein
MKSPLRWFAFGVVLFAGCFLLLSSDRWFLDNHTLDRIIRINLSWSLSEYVWREVMVLQSHPLLFRVHWELQAQASKLGIDSAIHVSTFLFSLSWAGFCLLVIAWVRSLRLERGVTWGLCLLACVGTPGLANLLVQQEDNLFYFPWMLGFVLLLAAPVNANRLWRETTLALLAGVCLAVAMLLNATNLVFLFLFLFVPFWWWRKRYLLVYRVGLTTCSALLVSMLLYSATCGVHPGWSEFPLYRYFQQALFGKMGISDMDAFLVLPRWSLTYLSMAWLSLRNVFFLSYTELGAFHPLVFLFVGVALAALGVLLRAGWRGLKLSLRQKTATQEEEDEGEAKESRSSPLEWAVVLPFLLLATGLAYLFEVQVMERWDLVALSLWIIMVMVWVQKPSRLEQGILGGWLLLQLGLALWVLVQAPLVLPGQYSVALTYKESTHRRRFREVQKLMSAVPSKRKIRMAIVPLRLQWLDANLRAHLHRGSRGIFFVKLIKKKGETRLTFYHSPSGSYFGYWRSEKSLTELVHESKVALYMKRFQASQRWIHPALRKDIQQWFKKQ